MKANQKEAETTHDKLRYILKKYGNPEFGDCIIDEISELFNYPTTINQSIKTKNTYIMKANVKINYNAIQKEIDNNYLDITSGIYDVYSFTGYISKKYFKPIDPIWGERTGFNPYLDMLFGMLEINGIELY